jgi:hypothetical protein
MTTDVAGRFAFENVPPRPEQGYLALLARRPGAVGIASVPVEGAAEPLDIVLRPAGQARGTVKDSAGKPLAGVLVTPESISIQSPDVGPEGWASATLPDELKKTWTAKTNAKGEYVLAGLLPESGSVSLTIERDGYNRASPGPAPASRRRRRRSSCIGAPESKAC